VKRWKKGASSGEGCGVVREGLKGLQGANVQAVKDLIAGNWAPECGGWEF
jgi:hypothetical protein